jgi:hypothetical protein
LKNLGYTIDRIIKIDNTLLSTLQPIKDKWKKYPQRVELYWKELINFLNSPQMTNHPKRKEISNIFLTKRAPTHKLTSFDDVNSSDQILGIIPEHLSDKIKRYDNNIIDTAKKHTEAVYRRDINMMKDVSRKEALLEIKLKQIWFDLKNHFKLWESMGYFAIKKRDNILLLVNQTNSRLPQQCPPNQFFPAEPENIMFRIPPELLRDFFRFLNIKPPPGMFPDEP